LDFFSGKLVVTLPLDNSIVIGLTLNCSEERRKRMREQC